MHQSDKAVIKQCVENDSTLAHKNAVKRYLKQYREYNVYIQNIKEEIEDTKELLLQDADPKVSRISNAPGSDGRNHSEPESVCMNKLENAPARIVKLQGDLQAIEPIIKRLSRSLDALEESDRQLMYNKWVEDYSWYVVARGQHWSIDRCRNRSDKVLGMLAVMMFGENIKSQ